MGSTLDQWGKPPQSTQKKSVILSDQHAHYLHEQSFGRQLDKLYDMQFERRVAEDKAKEERHKKYIGDTYVRVGGE